MCPKPYIRSSRDMHGFYSEIQIIFGTVYTVQFAKMYYFDDATFSLLDQPIVQYCILCWCIFNLWQYPRAKGFLPPPPPTHPAALLQWKKRGYCYIILDEENIYWVFVEGGGELRFFWSIKIRQTLEPDQLGAYIKNRFCRRHITVRPWIMKKKNIHGVCAGKLRVLGPKRPSYLLRNFSHFNVLVCTYSTMFNEKNKNNFLKFQGLSTENRDFGTV